MKFLLKLIIPLVFGLAVLLTQSTTAKACCCIDNNPVTGQCCDGCCVACPNPDGGGSDGGGGGSCNWSQVNCPAGGTRTNQVAAVSCGSSYCPAPGTAQAVTGCCGQGQVDEYGVWYCGNQQVTTYSCCPANTTPTETWVTGATYIHQNNCSNPSCNDGDDILISTTGAPQTVENRCGWDCSAWGGTAEDPTCRPDNRIWYYGTISTCQERHLEYSCVATCDANDWGAWGACSATCGEGTQTRTNACGTGQSQSCSTPCVAWWQVKDSDVSSRGDLTSILPPGKFFGLPGPGGYPGVAAYSETASLTSASVSQIGWIANSAVGNPKVYDYRYFANLLPADTVIPTISSNVLDQIAIDANTTPSYGYYWYRYDGSVSGLDLTVNSNLNIGSKKAVVMVNSAQPPSSAAFAG